MENEISAQEQTSSFPHFYFPEEQRILNESESENEIENENEEEIPQIQEEGEEIPQGQEEEIEEKIEEGIEEIPSNRIPQASTRLQDFVTYKVQYPI
jgi:hypothetical protein